MAGVQWARQIVYDNAPAGAPVHAGQPWALRLPAIPLENGSISGYVVDAQSRINVNNLGNAASQANTLAALTRLFATLSLPPTLLNAVIDWVDVDDRVTDPGGAEDAWYMAQATAGLSANGPVKRTSELLAVRGDNSALLSRMRPYVTALDAPTAVNVNTAAPEVLAAIANGPTDPHLSLLRAIDIVVWMRVHGDTTLAELAGPGDRPPGDEPPD